MHGEAAGCLQISGHYIRDRVQIFIVGSFIYLEQSTQSGGHFSLINIYRNGSNVGGMKVVLKKY
jgi:hypothetical protein